MQSELDGLIDGALSAYSGTEPRPGLEDRVLNRIRTAEAGRRGFRAWQWTVAVAALAAIIVIAIAPRPRHVRVVKQASLVAALPSPSMPAPRLAPKLPVRKRAITPKSYPKLAQFPTPAPLTVEEHALLAFVRQHPAEAQQVFAELRKQSNEPLEIQPIQIAPLQIDDAH